MNDDSLANRRTVLKSLSAGTLAALAGCTGSDDSDETPTEGTQSDEDSGTTDETATEEPANEELAYAWDDATWDSYWYSLYNMSTNIAMSGNGVTFPATEQQQETFQNRLPEMLSTAGESEPPVKEPNLNMAPFTEETHSSPRSPPSKARTAVPMHRR
ncbi:hypothetical protein [Halovenus salina]|uniref:TAT (Twin-arginine translocation) pathway signal sequence n=1 Tax=Halovenus salina TaxID=1510225 RepID=A0ABD5W355_9EURY